MPQGKQMQYVEVDGELHKECCLCRDFKPVSLFGPAKPYKDGKTRHKSQCRACENAKKLREYHEQKGQRKKRPKAVSYKYQLKTYGVTKEWFLHQFLTQKGECEICKEPLRNPFSDIQEGKDLAVDHCHTTGKVRGILCRSCNVSLGLLKENVETINRAARYLETHGDY